MMAMSTQRSAPEGGESEIYLSQANGTTNYMNVSMKLIEREENIHK